MLQYLYDHPTAYLLLALLSLVATVAAAAVVMGAIEGRLGDHKFAFPVSFMATCTTGIAGLAALASVAVGVGNVAEREIAARVLAKYGAQVTELGELRGRGDSVTSAWVINGKRSVCSINTSEDADPIVTCSEELPLVATP